MDGPLRCSLVSGLGGGWPWARGKEEKNSGPPLAGPACSGFRCLLGMPPVLGWKAALDTISARIVGTWKMRMNTPFLSPVREMLFPFVPPGECGLWTSTFLPPGLASAKCLAQNALPCHFCTPESDPAFWTLLKRHCLQEGFPDFFLSASPVPNHPQAAAISVRRASHGTSSTLTLCPLTQQGGAKSKVDVKSGKPARIPTPFLSSCVPLST